MKFCKYCGKKIEFISLINEKENKNEKLSKINKKSSQSLLYYQFDFQYIIFII